jgi:hypothetical protein
MASGILERWLPQFESVGARWGLLTSSIALAGVVIVRAANSADTNPQSNERRERRVEFLGEQDGPPERELKALLREELQGNPAIERAYLARIGFAPDASPSVALCIAPNSAESIALIDSVRRVFASSFARDTYLDILFPSEEQEVDLRRVCLPFFERPS